MANATERKTVDPAAIEGLKAKFGELHLFEAALDGQDVEDSEDVVRLVVRQPKRPEFSAMAREVLAGDAYKAMNNLLLDCTLVPEKEELKALVTRHPGLVLTFGGKLVGLAKANLKVTEKKL